MPIGRIMASLRGRKAVLAAAAFAVTSGWTAYMASGPDQTVVAIHQAIDKGLTPPAVELAVDKLIKPWEGLKLYAYQDQVGVWTICYGETLGVHKGMQKTLAECEAMLTRRVIHDYYLPLVDGVKGYGDAPDSVQASMLSGAYNFGTAGQLGSRAAKFVTRRQYRQACEAQTAWNKAKHQIVPGLVKRREMGDAQRLGEAELCVSGL
ncbi:lysozyme [Mesorhizobium sp. B2-8-9]|uniref:lysozyme n=1 Tax=Mesorhizobium sp. B2-8-9 TaxID=2589899 RepID=UPI00112BB244|nr:lysozyme [Mesorhizobium sp. B2-8-9]TPI86373.1 lysozyme [Mesorhizobium sp. B2-8-9]